MKKLKFLIILILTCLLVISQVAAAFAAPALKDAELIKGTVQEITTEIDPNTGIMTVIIKVLTANDVLQTVRISQEKAIELGILVLDEDGNPFANEDALEMEVEIYPTDVIPNQKDTQHPVGKALAAFFSDIPDMDYDAVMSAHEDGNGFGVIAQALWLTRKIGGGAEDFVLILQAKKDGDYSNFAFEDGTSPTSWGQFRKAVMGEDKKGNLGMVMSVKDKANDDDAPDNGNNGQGKDKDKDKDKGNNGKDEGKSKKP